MDRHRGREGERDQGARVCLRSWPYISGKSPQSCSGCRNQESNRVQALAPFATRVIGMDISDGMIDEFNKNVREEGRSDTVVGVKADILSGPTPAEVSGPEYFDFDVVVVSMALHHFEHPEQALKRLSERLKKGGVMMIVDLIPEHHDDHGLHQMGAVVETISKHGFSLEEMQAMYEDAGVKTGFKHQVVEAPLVFNKNGKTFEKTVFIARGQK
ncbi:S-adenosyl-L-methionine-dependent methyltransferase [Aspergillus varians]